MATASETVQLVGTRPPQKRWLLGPNLLRLRRLQKDDDYVNTQVPQRKMVPVDNGLTKAAAAPGFLKCWSTELSARFALVPVRLPAPASQHSYGKCSTISNVRVSV